MLRLHVGAAAHFFFVMPITLAMDATRSRVSEIALANSSGPPISIVCAAALIFSAMAGSLTSAIKSAATRWRSYSDMPCGPNAPISETDSRDG